MLWPCKPQKAAGCTHDSGSKQTPNSSNHAPQLQNYTTIGVSQELSSAFFCCALFSFKHKTEPGPGEQPDIGTGIQMRQILKS